MNPRSVQAHCYLIQASQSSERRSDCKMKSAADMTLRHLNINAAVEK
jgi:hypothetical protein